MCYVPYELLSESELTLVLRSLQVLPRLVDIGDKLSFLGQVRFLVVRSHLTLQSE